MHLGYLFTALLTAGTLTLAAHDCREEGWDCDWHGGWPYCGTDDRKWGYTGNDGWTLVATTEDGIVQDLVNNRKIQEDCAKEYGTTCWGGYKRLWCHTGYPPWNGYSH